MEIKKGRITNIIKIKMMKKALLPLSYLAPILVFAQDSTVGGLIPLMQNILGALTPIVVGLALLYFFWGLAKYILAQGNDEHKEEGKMIMVWGIIALFVMVSVWGIIGLLGETVGIEQGGTVEIPVIPGL
jgi:hypothetical protein